MAAAATSSLRVSPHRIGRFDVTMTVPVELPGRGALPLVEVPAFPDPDQLHARFEAERAASGTDTWSLAERIVSASSSEWANPSHHQPHSGVGVPGR